MQLFGTSGIRRVADKELIQLALKVGLAEAKSEARVHQLYDSALRVIKDCMEESKVG